MLDRMPVVFLHVPKTAGTSFVTIARARYQRRYNIPPGYRKRDLARLAIAARVRRLEFVSGHASYGIHHLIPGEVTYVTFLRDPVERVISMYFYLRDHALNNAWRAEMDAGMTLLDFARLPDRRITNGQVHQLAGFYHLGRPSIDELTQAAERNLCTIGEGVGVVEHLEVSMRRIAALLEWGEPPVLPRLRANSEKPLLSDDERQEIADLNSADRRLWHAATQMVTA